MGHPHVGFRSRRIVFALTAGLFLAAASDPGMAAAPFVTKRCSAKERARFPEKREQAVVQGTAWMAGFLEDPENLSGLGTDAAVIFLAGQNARSATVRDLSLPLARYEAGRLLPLLTASPLSSRSDLFEALWLLSESANLKLPAEPLMTNVTQRLLRLPTPESIYAIDLAHLDRIPEDDVYELLIDSYIADRAALAHPELPLTTFRLGKVLPFVLSRPYVRYDDDHSENHSKFVDHAYLATHVAYVLSDYARLKLKPEDLGPLYGYLRGEFPSALRYGSLELIAEFVDVFRLLGFDDRDDMVCQGTRFVLERQLTDGGWGGSKDGKPYDQIHATWVSVDALRDRNFLEGTPYAQFIKSLGPLAKPPVD
jgi:hypothetical protein